MRPLAFVLAGAALLSQVVALGSLRPARDPFVPRDPVRVHLDEVPPDACLELFGPGPCRPHGAAPTTGWTSAVAGPPPANWHGRVR